MSSATCWGVVARPRASVLTGSALMTRKRKKLTTVMKASVIAEPSTFEPTYFQVAERLPR